MTERDLAVCVNLGNLWQNPAGKVIIWAAKLVIIGVWMAEEGI
jgi:hypothetical protein